MNLSIWNLPSKWHPATSLVKSPCFPPTLAISVLKGSMNPTKQFQVFLTEPAWIMGKTWDMGGTWDKGIRIDEY